MAQNCAQGGKTSKKNSVLHRPPMGFLFRSKIAAKSTRSNQKSIFRQLCGPLVRKVIFWILVRSATPLNLKNIVFSLILTQNNFKSFAFSLIPMQNLCKTFLILCKSNVKQLILVDSLKQNRSINSAFQCKAIVKTLFFFSLIPMQNQTSVKHMLFR